MPVLRITKHGEKVLKTVCEPVDFAALEPELPSLLRDMWATMYSVRGVGLAAPQIGRSLRLSVIDCKPDGKSQKLVLINPVILSLEGEINDEEGCLSVPGVYSKLKRAGRCTVRALNEKGETWEMTGEGLLARAFQHEIDHLDGKLFIDRLEFTQKLRVMSVIKDVKPTWS